MHGLSALSIAAAVLYGVIGFFAYGKDKTSGVNRLFLGLSLLFAVWAGANGFAIASESNAECLTLYRRFSFVWFLFPPLLLHFVLRLTGYRDGHFFTTAGIYVPGILLYFLSDFGTAIIAGFAESSAGRYILYEHSSPWYYLNILHYSLYLTVVLLLFLRWYRRGESPRRRRQARIILLGFLAGFVISSIFGTLLPLLGYERMPPIAPVGMLLWLFGMGYAITKYRLMTLTPDIAAATILQHIHDVVILCDTRGRIIHLNHTADRLCRRREQHVLGNPIHSILPSLEGLLKKPDDDNSFSPATTYIEGLCRSSDGTDIPLDISISMISDPSDEALGYIVIGHDLRPLKTLEEEKDMHVKTADRLRASEEKFMKTFYLSPVGMALFSRDHMILKEINDAGKEALEIESSHEKTEIPWEREADRNLFSRELHYRGRVDPFSAPLRRNSGEPLHCLISADTVDIGGESHILLCMVDLTRQNRAEEELARMQRFESIGLLAGGIAHDFNNLLTSIMGNIGLIKPSSGLDEEAREALAAAESASKQASRLTGRLLSFSKSDSPHTTSVNLDTLIEESAALSLSGSETGLDMHVEENLWRVSADEGQIIQVCNNLLINAKQAMGDKGTVEVQLQNTEISSEFYRLEDTPLSLLPGRYVKVAISDTGEGIPKRIMKKLFDPYFTTKEGGSGLGLTIVYSILKKHGGDITVSSKEGKGTQFTFFLPAETDRE